MLSRAASATSAKSFRKSFQGDSKSSSGPNPSRSTPNQSRWFDLGSSTSTTHGVEMAKAHGVANGWLNKMARALSLRPGCTLRRSPFSLDEPSRNDWATTQRMPDRLIADCRDLNQSLSVLGSVLK